MLAVVVACTSAPVEIVEEEEEFPTRVETHWTDQFEWFVEHPLLVVGLQASFAAHLTRLDGFRAVEEGRLTLELLGPDGSVRQNVEAEAPVRSGIFVPLLVPEAAGGGSLRLIYPRGERIDWRRRGMILLLAAPVLLYVIKIGGDGRHFRYLAFPYCLLACAFGGIPERAWSYFRLRSPALLLPVAGVLVGLLTLSLYPRQLDRHPLRGGVGHKTVDGFNDAEIHRSRIVPRFGDWSEKVTPSILREYVSTSGTAHWFSPAPAAVAVGGALNTQRRIKEREHPQAPTSRVPTYRSHQQSVSGREILANA